ncbi:hypothetical protein EVAR_35437_1 [Eumeta japonica]|uniref:Uncharacterized protein n=1 Tax=Eumeta variegata TaxID=151549 RepID=A0A4C1X6S9_EUMVA|nr:hypothetical protein EVAR_35437_1 [Eumeta japonica]
MIVFPVLLNICGPFFVSLWVVLGLPRLPFVTRCGVERLRGRNSYSLCSSFTSCSHPRRYRFPPRGSPVRGSFDGALSTSSIPPPSDILLLPEIGNAQVTPWGLRVPMDGDDSARLIPENIWESSYQREFLVTQFVNSAPATALHRFRPSHNNNASLYAARAIP